VTDMTASDILALKPVQARILFPGDDAAVSLRFKALAKAWHPDTNPGVDATVFAHVVELHSVLKRGVPANERIFRTTDGRTFRFAYLVRHVTDFGEVLVGRTRIAHVVPADLADLARRADAFRPTFADDGMRKEMERFLPHRSMTLETADGTVFVEEKTADQILLRDLMALAPFDPRHAAWMATRLVNLACWLQWTGIAHGALGPDTLLVSPEFHSVSITGPFLSARSIGQVPFALPERTLSVCPRYSVDGQPADARLDPELVRATVRECLGDRAGTRLAADPDFPKPFANWLLMPAKDAQSDFPAWERARDASFGARRFIHWDVDPVALMAA
jgi:hypothetical protein